MNRVKILQMLLLAALMSGCSKADLDVNPDVGASGSDQISFGSSAVWTKGLTVDDAVNMDQEAAGSGIYVYSYYIDGNGSELLWENAEASDIAPYFTTSTSTPFFLSSTIADGAVTAWSYEGGTRYWPTDPTRKLSFLTFYPSSELDYSINSSTGKPDLSYTMSPLANENHDLVVDAQLNLSSATNDDTAGRVEFSMEHVLTKILLQASCTGEILDIDGQTALESPAYDGNEIYMINGITFHNLYAGANLTIFPEDGSVTWDLLSEENGQTTIDLTAAQGNTLLGLVDPYDYKSYSTDQIAASGVLTETVASVMASGEAIFALPQALSENHPSGTAPTVSVRIRRAYYAPLDATSTDTSDTNKGKLVEIIYETEEVEIPIPKDSYGEYVGMGWKQNQCVTLSLNFNLSELDEYETPLTVFSTVYDWTDTEVDVEVSPNIYIYASDEDIEVAATATTADFYVYTNYEYDLRFERTKYELDGSETTAEGFTFYPSTDGVSFYTAINPVWVDASGTEIAYTPGTDSNGNLILTVGGSTIYAYSSTGGGGFFDVAGYYVVAEGEDIPCYSYGSSYTGEMTSTVDWLKFRVDPYGSEDEYSFYYYLALTTRQQLGLYTNSSVAGDDSYGINKDENDAVYILRLEINEDHLIDGQYFYGKIGAEMLSNGGGSITNLFNVSLTKLTE